MPIAAFCNMPSSVTVLDSQGNQFLLKSAQIGLDLFPSSGFQRLDDEKGFISTQRLAAALEQVQQACDQLGRVAPLRVCKSIPG